jgi:DNA polymerase-4
VARLARGEDLREVEPYRAAVSYSEENTFGSDVSDRSVLEAALITHSEAVARRLRSDRIAARTVVLKLKLARRRATGPRGYPLLSRRATLREPTDDGGVISRTAIELLTRAELQEPVRLLGVGVTNLVEEGSGQLELFPASEPGLRERRARLNRALDEIEARFGSAAVTRGEKT